MKLRNVLTSALVIAALSVSINANAGSGFLVPGTQLAEWARAFERAAAREGIDDPRVGFGNLMFMSYVSGAFDVFGAMGTCLPSAVTTGQVSAVVAKFLKENPERWHESGARLVASALTKAFPCQQ